jgi:thioredoxin reductase
VHGALLWRQWSPDVTLLLQPGVDPSDEEREQLAARGVTVVDGAVERLVVTGDRLTGARLVDGRVVPLDAVAVATRMVARSELLESLGLAAVDVRVGDVSMGAAVPSDATGATAVPGVWVAGNVTDLQAQVVVAAAGGVRAGAAVNADLVTEDVRLAVAERRGAVERQVPAGVADRPEETR